MAISIQKYDNGNPFDFGKTSEVYAKYRDIYPPEFYEKLVELKLGVKGQRCLDLGTGTGVLPRNMYKYGAQWLGTDISENQIKYAQKLSQENGMDIKYLVSSAEELDFPAGSFDIVTACQCFGYFNKEVILPKIHKFLVDGGHFAVLFMAWLPYESEIAMTSENIVLKYNPDWNGGRMKRYDLPEPEWSKEYFTLANAITFDIPLTFTREGWHGRIKSCRGIGASNLSPDQIAAWEKEHLEYMNTLPETFEILHYVSMLDFKKKL